MAIEHRNVKPHLQATSTLIPDSYSSFELNKHILPFSFRVSKFWFQNICWVGSICTS